MKNILFFLFFAICSSSYAQEKTQNKDQADTSSTYMIRLTDNTALSGKILERNSNEIIFNDLTIGKVTIPVMKIQKIIRLSGDQQCILTTTDGKTFTGILLAQGENEITLKTESLGTLNISSSKIKDIKLVEKEQIVNGKYYFKNPHPTRYFFGPTAIPLKKGEGYYQNAYILANSVQMGVTDHFSMGGGIGIPLLFFITPKVGFKVSENVHVGGGILAVTTLTSDVPFGIGVGYGSLTIGNMENNFTISGGWGAIKQKNYDNITNKDITSWELAKKPMITVSGMARLAPKLAVITENWFFATKDYTNDPNPALNTYSYKYHSVLSGGFRIMGEKNSFDIALLVPSVNGSKTIGLPYLDYVFKF
jgi:hypothetical protein